MMSLEVPKDSDIAKQPLLKDFFPDTWRSLSSKASKVRLVRCPKCRGVLPELADVPVYKCGGCNATLRGKNYKQAQESPSSDASRNNSSLKNESEINLKVQDSPDSDISSQESNLSTKETPRQVEPEDPHRKQSESETGNAPHEISHAENTCQEKEELSIEVGEEKHAENCNGGNSNGGSQSPDTLLVSGGSSPSDDTSERSIEKDLYSDLKSSSENTESHGSKCMASRETLQTTETNELNVTSDGAEDDLKFSEKNGDVSKSLAPEDDPFDSRVASSYGLGEQPRDKHAFDKKVPSSDGLGEQVFEQNLPMSKRPIVESQIKAESICKGQETRYDQRVKNKINVNVEDKNLPAKLLLKPVNGKSDSSFVGDFPLEPVSHDTEALQNLNRNVDSKRFHQVPYFKLLEKDKPFLKERHINRRRKSADYDHVHPLNSWLNEFQSSSSFHLAENRKLDERSQLELLKKLDELRDHLNKAYAHQKKAKENMAPRYNRQDQKHRPLHGMQKPLGGENSPHCISCHPHHQRPEAFKLRKSTTYRGGCSSAFQTLLGSDCMHRADNPHSHGFHEDWECLQKLEPPNIFYDRGLHQTCTGYKCYNPYTAITSSPCRPQCSNFPRRGCDEAQPRHHMLRNFDNEVAKLRLKERRQGLMQHCRPMAGGAPFISCYHCSQLLKIPEEFLHARKRSHMLKCGSCFKVLMFSLHKRIHIVPHSPKSVLPPSSDEVANSVDNNSSAGNSSNANCCIQGDSTSYSEEDYGLPTFKSCSTESEPALPTSFPSPQINKTDQIKPSSIHTALQNGNMKKTAMSILNNKNKHPIDFRKHVGSSSDQARLSLKAEAANGTGSPLHRLMGYSSPTDIINGTGTAVIHP